MGLLTVLLSKLEVRVVAAGLSRIHLPTTGMTARPADITDNITNQQNRLSLT
jgi:hypothetical protein